jgi:large subunit ribosomal protein L30
VAEKTPPEKAAAKKKKGAAKKSVPKKSAPNTKGTPKKESAAGQSAPKSDSAKRVKITQVRSGIGRQEGHRRTIRALGIKRHQQSVVHELTPAIEGMINRVSFMVEVEEVE